LRSWHVHAAAPGCGTTADADTMQNRRRATAADTGSTGSTGTWPPFVAALVLAWTLAQCRRLRFRPWRAYPHLVVANRMRVLLVDVRERAVMSAAVVRAAWIVGGARR
jgi:hypothetical protein